MDAVITSLYNGLPIFMLHGGTAILMLIVGAFIYSKITPWNELDLIMEGNTAAAVSFSGAILGIAIPLAAALSSSTPDAIKGLMPFLRTARWCSHTDNRRPF